MSEAPAAALEALRADPLFSIIATGRTVPINKGEVRVVGVSWTLIGEIVQGFPQLAELIAKFTGEDEADAKASDMVQFALWMLTHIPAAVPTLLAAGIGRPRDLVAEAIMGRLDAMAQLDLINEVLKETIGGDLDFFAAKLKAIGASVGYGAAAEAPAQSGRLKRHQPAAA